MSYSLKFPPSNFSQKAVELPARYSNFRRLSPQACISYICAGLARFLAEFGSRFRLKRHTWALDRGLQMSSGVHGLEVSSFEETRFLAGSNRNQKRTTHLGFRFEANLPAQTRFGRRRAGPFKAGAKPAHGTFSNCKGGMLACSHFLPRSTRLIHK